MKIYAYMASSKCIIVFTLNMLTQCYKHVLWLHNILQGWADKPSYKVEAPIMDKGPIADFIFNG
jgi:hypothetical protein